MTKDFDNLDSELQNKEVFAYFGKAIFHAQILEQQAINMIVVSKMVNNNVIEPGESQKLWDEYDLGSKTLGKLLMEIKKIYTIEEEDIQELQQILKLRNYITHDYFRFNHVIAHSESGRKRIIGDMNNFCKKVDEIDSKLMNYFEIYKKRINVSDEKINNYLETERKVYEKSIIDENYITIIK